MAQCQRQRGCKASWTRTKPNEIDEERERESVPSLLAYLFVSCLALTRAREQAYKSSLALSEVRDERQMLIINILPLARHIVATCRW